MKDIEVTPFKIELLLWYYYSPSDHPSIDTPAGISAMKEFIEAGIFWEILKEDPNARFKKRYGYHQSALDVYVNALLAVPLPKQIWVCEK